MTDFENTVLGDLGFETSNEQQTPAPAYESPLVNPDETTSFDNGVLSNLGFETEQVVPDITSSYEAGGKDDPSIAKQNKDFEQKHGMSLSDMTQIDPARAEVCKILNTTPEDFSKTYPRLANAYSNPYILSMAKEDTQSLMRIENGLKLLENQRKVANQVLGDQAENIDEEGATSGWESGDVRDQGPNVISATVQQGASQLFGGLFKTAISAVEAAGGNPDTLKVFDKSLNQIKQGIDSWGDDFTTMNKEWNWLQKNLAGGASSGVMMSLTYGAGFMLAAGLMASGIGTPAAMALMGKLSLGLMAMSAYGQAYDEGRKKGLSVGEAAGHGAWQGGWEYITEKMNIKAVKDLYFANKPMLRDIANFMKKEVGTEELNSFMQGIEEAFVMPDQTVGEFLKPANLLNMVAETAIQTVVGAGVQTGTARGLHSLVTSDTMQLGGAVIELAKTQENVNLLRSMADYAQNSALAQRAPEQLAKVVAEVTKNDTPWAYISNEALTPAIRDRIRAVAPNLDDAITKAVTLQEDLAMPIEAFAQIINDESVVETLNDHVKFDQNGITVSEAKQNLAAIAEQSKAEVARLIEEQKKAADGTSETQQIIDDLTPILRDTGTIIGQTAKDQAVLWGKFFTRLSGQFEKAGKTVSPMELYKKYRSKIVGPDTEMVRMDTFNRMSKASRGLASLLSEFDKKVNDKGSKWGQVQWLKDRVQEAVKTLPEGNEMRTQLENIKSRNSEEYRNKVEAILKSAQSSLEANSFHEVVNSQKDDVRAKYQGTSQWMKAPNGKPTNLTEDQWLAVRTPAFKNWFGDWENALYSSKSDNGTITLGDGSSVSWIVNKDPITRIDENGDIVEDFGDEYVLITHLEAKTHGKKIGRKLLREAIRRIKSENKGMAIRLAAKPIADEFLSTDQLVKYYESEGFSIEETGNAPFPVMSYHSRQSSGINDDVSKVVDENGEPLVVYHYTMNDWSSFDMSEARQYSDLPSAYFSPDQEEWMDMGDKRIGAFLNIRNPIEKPMAKMEGDKVKQDLINKGYDGTIVTEDGNIVEYGAFYPNQIKSSTNNNGNYDPNNPDIYQQKVISIKPVQYEDSPDWRVLKRTPSNMTKEEKKVFKEYLDSRDDAERIKSNLKRLKDTPWEKQAIEAVFIRSAMQDLMNGNEPRVQSMLDHPQMKNTRDDLSLGEKGLWMRLEENGFVGDASKPAHNVNSSFLNCDPSNDCAKFCYATSGNYRYAATVVKSELVSEAIRLDPKRAAEITFSNYKGTPEFYNNKALRLFDKGDGDETWLPYIEELNKLGVRVQIFSKKPEFLRKVSDYNVRLLSIDESNKAMASQNKDLDIAFVYSSKKQIPDIVNLNKEGRLAVVLPVKQGRKLLSQEKVNELIAEDKSIAAHVCPIDAGWKVIKDKKHPDGWNCTKCDKNGGVGCFRGQTTQEAMDAAAKSEAELIKYQDMDEASLVRAIQDTKKELDDAIRGIEQSKPVANGTDAERGSSNESDGRGRVGDVSTKLDELLQALFYRINTRAKADVSELSVGEALVGLQGRETALQGMEDSNGTDQFGNSGNAPTDSFQQRIENILPQAVRDAMRQIAYNGSPYIFDKFSLDHIGSGEGAQAHGRGLYFSLNRNVAEGYKDVLTGSKDKFIDNFSVEGVPFVEYMNKLDKQDKLSQDKYAVMETFFVNLNRNYRDSKNFIEYVKENLDVFKDETVYHKDTYEFVKDLSERVDYVLENDVAHGGRVYEVSIPDDNVMIREEAKFSEQPEFVQTALKKLVKENFASKSSSYSVEYDKNSYEEFARSLIQFCNERDPDNKLGIAVDIRNYLRNPTMYGYSQKTKNSVMDSYVKTTKLSIDELRKYFSENGDGLTWISKESVSEFMDITAQIDSIVNVKEKTRSRSTIALNGKTGREIYNELAEAVGDEDATEMMSSYGVKGIRYTGRLDGECAVVWDEEAIKIIDFFEKHPEKLMEAKGEANVGAERGDIAGWWSKSSNTLGLTKHTNITTFAHESGHMFLNIYFEIARDADAPQSIKRDVATLLDWFGLKDLQQYFDLEAKGPDFVREYHEKFARGFEAYLREGKAPSKGLEDIFYKFKRWITDWYKDKTDKETIDNAQSDLTADVRAVMARMLASEEEIDRENKIRSFANLWQDRKNFPGNDEQYLDYIKLVKDSDLEARAMLTAAYMEELEFMTERKTVIMAELANQYNEEYNDAYEDAKERLLSNPLYKALERITKDEEAVSLKIATSEVSTLPENTVARLNALGVLSDDGMPLDAVAKQLGFEDPVEFINGMSKLQPLEQKAREMAEAQMTVDNEDIMTREGRDAVATAAVMNELAMKRAEKEYAIVKATKKTPELVSAATLDAEEAFGSMRLGSVKTGHYKQKANKASQNAVAAAAKGDTQAAADAKKAEVFSMAKAKKAADIINRKEKLVKLALRMKRKAKKLAQRRQLDSQFIDQVLSLMSHYTTRRNGKTVILGIENPSRRSFDEFKKSWTEKGVPLDAIDDTLFSGIKDIDDMTVDQFDTLADAVSILVTQGRRVSQISKENYKVNLQNIADACAFEIESSNKEIPFKVSRTDSRIQKIKGYFLSHRKLSSMIYELGGFKYGTMADVILTRLNDAASREATMTTDFGKKYWDLVKGLNNLNEKAVVKGIHTPNGAIVSEMMTKRDRLAIALNAGNVDNKQRLEADGFDQLTIYNVFSTLTDEEIQFVQNAWDLIDQFWKPLADLELRTNGLEPKKVLPVPITVMSKNQNKIELKGGYYPIKYDTSKNTQAAENELKDYADSLFRGAVTSSATKQGHAKRREEKTDMHLLLDPNVIGIHAQQVIHDLCFREALQDINKLFRNDTFKNAVVSRRGADWYAEMTDALNSIAINGSTAERMNKEANSAFGYLRGTLSASVMGLSATTALLQPLGLLQSAARLGPKAILSGIVHSLENNKNNSCYDKSEMMRNRRLTMNTEIREVGRSMSRIGNPKLGKAWQDFNKVLFAPMMAMQQIVDVPTWYGAYDLARSEGKTEQEAIAFADQTVIDTQGSGDIKDTSKIHRNNPIWMMFYSYFSATYQLLVESGKKNASKGAVGATLFARDVLMLLAIPNLSTALFFGFMRGTEPPEDEGEWLMFALREFGGAVLNMFFLVRELNPVIEAAFQMGGGNAPSYNGPAVMRIVPDLTRLTQAMLGDKDAFDKTMAVMPFIGDITGLPTVQLQRSLKGAKAYIEGETDMPTAVLFGKPTKEY